MRGAGSLSPSTIAGALLGIFAALVFTAAQCFAQPAPKVGDPVRTGDGAIVPYIPPVSLSDSPYIAASQKVDSNALDALHDGSMGVRGFSTGIDQKTGTVTYTVFITGACDGQPTPALRDQVEAQIAHDNPGAGVKFDRAPHIVATHATFIDDCKG